MNDVNALWLLLAVPLIGSVVCALLPGARHVRCVALAFSIATALLGVCLAVRFDWHAGNEMHWGFGENNPFQIASIGFAMKFGVDAVSLWLVLLTVLLSPLAIAASFQSIKTREKEYYAWMLLLLVPMNGVFIARDVLLFYVFFE